MELTKEFFKEVLLKYFQESFNTLPEIIKDAVNGLISSQDFVPIAEIAKRYNLSRRTLYNYHKKKYITLYSSEGKTFISIKELENHIRSRPLPAKDQAEIR